jgi:nitrate reductase NapAB chaperone NapD
VAITGLVVMTMQEDTGAVQERLLAVEGLSFYGHAKDGSLVCVLEAPSGELEDRLRGISEVEGVAAVLPASVNMEDELEAKGII